MQSIMLQCMGPVYFHLPLNCFIGQLFMNIMQLGKKYNAEWKNPCNILKSPNLGVQRKS